jgi:cysteinyl-tRNA synthetase
MARMPKVAAALLALAVMVAAREPPSARTREEAAAPPPSKPSRLAAAPSAADALAERLRLVNGARSWGYQLQGLKVEQAARSPYDLLVVDATTGLAAGRHFRPEEVASLKRKPDGSRRVVVSYLSVGEAEDYRPDYFTKEYMSEDAPDWLLHENRDWKGNRIIRFCTEGWQQTILGDESGRSVYNSIEWSPLYRLIELGFDGVYLDRVDVYEETARDCPDGARRMVDFIVRLAAHARRRNPHFLVIQQNAEDLLKQRRMVDAIDAVAKEGLIHSWTRAGGNGANSIKWSVDRLNIAKQAGRAVFVVDYTRNRAAADISVRRIRELGFVPYIGPKDLGSLWLPGVDF